MSNLDMALLLLKFSANSVLPEAGGGGLVSGGEVAGGLVVGGWVTGGLVDGGRVFVD